MAFLPLLLETRNNFFRKVFNVPLVGGMLFFSGMLILPAIISFGSCYLMGLYDSYIPKIMFFLLAAEDLALRKYGSYLSIIFIPAWILFLAIGIAALFGGDLK